MQTHTKKSPLVNPKKTKTEGKQANNILNEPHFESGVCDTFFVKLIDFGVPSSRVEYFYAGSPPPFFYSM